MTGSTVKLIALLSMFIDHVGAAILGKMVLTPFLLDVYRMTRYIGRMAFPLFCFLLVEGFLHTKDVKKYLLRLGIFAIISEIPFDLAISGRVLEFGHQNVFFTLYLGLLAIYILDAVRKQQLHKAWYLFLPVALLVADILDTDYSSAGVLVILTMYLWKDRKWLSILAGSVLLYLFYGTTELAALVAIVPVMLYNGNRGARLKYLFYCFYPIHLLVLYLVRVLFFQ